MSNSILAAPAVAHLAVLAGIRAVAMGLVSEAELKGLSSEAFVDLLLNRAQGVGIGRGLTPPVMSDADGLSGLLEELLHAMEASPVPDSEWPAVESALGPEQLGSLLGVSSSSLKRYASGSRPTPDSIAARLHFLGLVVGDLAGSYNGVGVRLWFDRKRAQLSNRTPAQLLHGDWSPDDEGPSKVRALAAALVVGPGA